MGDSLANVADSYYRERDYEQAIQYETQSLKWFQNRKILEKQSNALNNIGLYFYLLGQYDSSLHYYSQSLDIDLTLDKPRRVISRYNNIGITYKKIGDYIKALDNHTLALELSMKAKERSQIGSIYLSIANLLLIHFAIEERKRAVHEFYLVVFRIIESLDSKLINTKF